MGAANPWDGQLHKRNVYCNSSLTVVLLAPQTAVRPVAVYSLSSYMITFFRKIRKALVDTGATGKYLLYAVGEIALVVIGILIALQINNWNEEQKAREIETKVLYEVVENLEANIQRLESNIERGKTDNEFTDIIISVIDHKLPYSDSLDRHFPLALNAVDEGSFLSYVGYESLKNVGLKLFRVIR